MSEHYTTWLMKNYCLYKLTNFLPFELTTLKVTSTFLLFVPPFSNSALSMVTKRSFLRSPEIQGLKHLHKCYQGFTRNMVNLIKGSWPLTRFCIIRVEFTPYNVFKQGPIFSGCKSDDINKHWLSYELFTTNWSLVMSRTGLWYPTKHIPCTVLI